MAEHPLVEQTRMIREANEALQEQEDILLGLENATASDDFESQT